MTYTVAEDGSTTDYTVTVTRLFSSERAFYRMLLKAKNPALLYDMTAIHPQNYSPFIPPHVAGTTFGGWQGILAGTAQIFIAAYVGFDAIAANTAETINPQKTMPRGLIGTLVLGTGFFNCSVSSLWGCLNTVVMQITQNQPLGHSASRVITLL